MKQRQITKTDIKNRVLHDFLFGTSDPFPVTICEFVADKHFFNHCSPNYPIKKIKVYLISEEDFSVEKILVKELELDNTISFRNNNITGSVFFSIVPNNEGSVESKQTISIKGTDGSETQKKYKSVGNFPLDFDKVLINIVFVGSYCVPMVRIFEIKGDITPSEFHPEIGVDSILSERYPKYLSLIYDSTQQKIIYNETVVRANNTVLAPMEKLKNKVEGLYSLSSISKETIKYDEWGEVVKYENSNNGISSKVIYTIDSVRKEVYFHGRLIYFNEFIKNDHKQEIRDSFGNYQLTTSGDDNPMGKCSVYDLIYENRVTGYRRITSAKPDEVVSGSHFYNLENISEEPFDTCTVLKLQRIANPEKEGFPKLPFSNPNITRNCLYGIYHYSDEEISVDIYIVQNELTEEIVFRKAIGTYKGEVCFDYNMNAIETVLLGSKSINYNETFSSKSGIQYNAIYNSFNVLQEFKDNDIHVKNYLFTTEMESELMNTEEEFFYARDMFGIPYKYQKVQFGLDKLNYELKSELG